jgi:hypothetical protein
LSNKFSRLAKDIPEDGRYGSGNVLAKTIVEELKLFGISTLAQLDKVIPKDLEDYYLADMSEENYAGIVRDILMISDIEKYFEVSWRKSWQGTQYSTVELLAKYGVDPSYLEKHDIDFLNPE